jgi:hypothetical protein
MAAIKQFVFFVWAISFILSPVLAQVPDESDFTSQDIEQGDALALLSELASNSSSIIARRNARRSGSGCTPSQLRIRREW